MIRKKEIEKIPPLPVKAEGKGGWTGRVWTAGDAIVMDVYEDTGERLKKEAEVRFRWVSDKKNFYTYSFGTGVWTRQGMYEAMNGYVGYTSNIGIRIDKKGQETTEAFLKGEDIHSWRKDAANRLYGLEDHIREEKRERREELRRERIEKRQKAKKPLPKDWDRWLEKYVFKEERYLFYDSGKRTTGACAYCGETVKLSGRQRHNGYGKCPACGSRIQYKAEKKAGEVRNKKQAVYLQKTKEGFLARYVRVEKRSARQGESYRSEEVVLGTWNGEKTWYDYRTGMGVWEDGRPIEMNGWDGSGYLYTRNVKKVLEGTVFQYAPLREWMRHEGKEIPFLGFMSKYEGSPFLEFFVKTGLYRLTREYAKGYERWSGRTPEEILGIDRHRIRRLAAMDGGKNALGWLKYEQKTGTAIREDVIGWLEEEGIRESDCRDILGTVKSVTRMAGYIKKQDIPADEVLTVWRDYLRMAAGQGMDITDDIVTFPKELRRRHDELAAAEDEKKEQERMKEYTMLDEKIKSRFQEASRYFWEDGEYVVIPAGGCKELMEEGRTLHHCVGKGDYYMRKMADGMSWICFLRKKEKPETPWYTIEVSMDDDRILQYYSEFDRRPELEIVNKILKAFKKSIQKKREKTRVRIYAGGAA